MDEIVIRIRKKGDRLVDVKVTPKVEVIARAITQARARGRLEMVGPVINVALPALNAIYKNVTAPPEVTKSGLLLPGNFR